MNEEIYQFSHGIHFYFAQSDFYKHLISFRYFSNLKFFPLHGGRGRWVALRRWHCEWSAIFYPFFCSVFREAFATRDKENPSNQSQSFEWLIFRDKSWNILEAIWIILNSSSPCYSNSMRKPSLLYQLLLADGAEDAPSKISLIYWR